MYPILDAVCDYLIVAIPLLICGWAAIILSWEGPGK